MTPLAIDGATTPPAMDGAMTPPAPPADVPYARGGQRLAALYYVAEGAEQFRTLYDSQLAAPCEFVHGENGLGFRCVPTARLDEVLYLDAACEQPAVRNYDYWRSGRHSTPSGWRSAPAPEASCAGDLPPYRATYKLGEQVFDGGLGVRPLDVYTRVGAGCEPTWLQVGHVVDAVQRLLPVAESELVAARLELMDVGSGLFIRRLVADDGTQITVGVAGLGQLLCSLQKDGQCVPEPIAKREPGGYGPFLDAACEQIGWQSASSPSCGTPRFGVTQVDDVVRVHELVRAQAVFEQQQIWDTRQLPPTAVTTCVQNEGPIYVFDLGQEVASPFPRARTLRTGSGQLHLLRFAAPARSDHASDAVIPLEPGGNFVDDRAYPCEVREAVDGTYRCLPLRAAVHEADSFADAGCSERLYARTDSTVATADLRLADYDYDTFTGRLTTLFSLKDHRDQIYQVVQTVCTPAPPAPDSLLAKDKELPLTTLAAVEAVSL
jgi:hypothetical protein